MIKATGEVETLPDMASFRIELSCLKKSIKESKACLVDKSNELNKTLLGFGIDQKDILTTAVNLNKSYNYTNNSQVFAGYNSSTTLYITIRDLNNLDIIYTELLENRNLELNALAYSHSKLDSLKNEAYVKALKNSQVLADKLLSEIPGAKKEILKIGNVEISSSLPEAEEAKYDLQSEAMASGLARNKSISISKGTVVVNAVLYVEFQVK